MGCRQAGGDQLSAWTMGGRGAGSPLRGRYRPTCEEAAARGLLPADFEWMSSTYSGGAVYAACRRSGRTGMAVPVPRQWGHTLPLAMCGAAMRARAGLEGLGCSSRTFSPGCRALMLEPLPRQRVLI